MTRETIAIGKAFGRSEQWLREHGGDDASRPVSERQAVASVTAQSSAQDATIAIGKAFGRSEQWLRDNGALADQAEPPVSSQAAQEYLSLGTQHIR